MMFKTTLTRFSTTLTKAVAPTLLALGLMSAAALAPLSVAASPASQAESNMDKMTEHLGTLKGEEFETHWMHMMIMHHQGAVDMAELVPTRSNRQEVKDIANQIIADQTREIGQMTGWLKQWYNVDPMTDMMGGGMMHEDMMDMPGMMEMMQEHESMMTMLRGLSGDEFDKQFLMMMRMHHMSALDMAELVPTRATHEELKTLAQNIITSQRAEIAQFEGWLMSWYGIDAATTEGAMPGEHDGHTPGMPRTGLSGETMGTLALGMIALSLAGISLGFALKQRGRV
jgi:uncharacterized protein (DUF305 family)